MFFITFSVYKRSDEQKRRWIYNFIGFAPIRYFNFWLWLYRWASSLCTISNKTKSSRISKFYKKLKFLQTNFCNFAGSVQSFWRLLDTNKQRKRQKRKVDIYIKDCIPSNYPTNYPSSRQSVYLRWTGQNLSARDGIKFI